VERGVDVSHETFCAVNSSLFVGGAVFHRRSQRTIDTSTGTAYGSGITFKAPQNSKVVSPNTTLVEKVLSNNSALTQEEAVEKVAASLGLTGVDVLSFDAYADQSSMTDEEKETAHSVKQANNKVMTVIKTFAAAAEGAGLDEEDAFDVSVGAFLETVISGVVIDFSAGSDHMGAVTTKLKTDAAAKAVDKNVTLNEAQFAAVVDSAAKSVANVASLISATDKNSTDEELSDLFSTVSVVASEVLKTSIAVTSGEIGSDIAAIERSMTTTDITAVTSKVNNNSPTDLMVNDAEFTEISEDAPSLDVGVMEVTDATVGDTYTFAISGGQDADKFAIDANGVLSILEQPDYEAQSSYEVGVTVTDTGGIGKSYVEVFSISVGDVDEAPTLTVPTGGSVTEDAQASTITGSLVGSDPEGGTLTYEITDATATNGSYSVTGTYGTLVLNASTGAYTYTLDNSASAVQELVPGNPTTETFSVLVSDGKFETNTENLTFTINGSSDAQVQISIDVNALEGLDAIVARDVEALADKVDAFYNDPSDGILVQLNSLDVASFGANQDDYLVSSSGIVILNSNNYTLGLEFENFNPSSLDELAQLLDQVVESKDPSGSIAIADLTILGGFKKVSLSGPNEVAMIELSHSADGISWVNNKAGTGEIDTFIIEGSFNNQIGDFLSLLSQVQNDAAPDTILTGLTDLVSFDGVAALSDGEEVFSIRAGGATIGEALTISIAGVDGDHKIELSADGANNFGAKVIEASGGVLGFLDLLDANEVNFDTILADGTYIHQSTSLFSATYQYGGQSPAGFIDFESAEVMENANFRDSDGNVITRSEYDDALAKIQAVNTAAETALDGLELGFNYQYGLIEVISANLGSSLSLSIDALGDTGENFYVGTTENGVDMTYIYESTDSVSAKLIGIDMDTYLGNTEVASMILDVPMNII